MNSAQLGQSIYLDHNASTPLDPRVLEAMLPYMSMIPRNPHSSDHAFGWSAGDAVQAARQQVASTIGADSDEIFFTAGATEANNLAILGIMRALPVDRRRLLVSAIEHKAVLSTARAAREMLGVEIEIVPVDADGIIDIPTLRGALNEQVGLVSVMLFNNEIGTRQPIEAVAEACREVGALLHTDAAQALTAEQLDVFDLGVDLLSLSSHKAYGPMGIGALYVARNIQPRPLPLIYGGDQEGGLRSGTVPTALCVGFGAACALIEREGVDERIRLRQLRDDFLFRLIKILPDAILIGDPTARHPGSISLRLPGIAADRLVAELQPKLAVSTGSACTSGIPEPSHVLTAIGMTAPQARQVVRIGLGRSTTPATLDAATSLIASAADRVQNAASAKNC